MENLLSLASANIDARIEEFKSALGAMDSRSLIHRFILGGDCYALGRSSHELLKERISERFAIHSMEVVVVGSAKLGFTISPSKSPYRHFDDTSDLDVAIVSPQLFEYLWAECYSFYSQPGTIWKNMSSFSKYLFRGWIRPDQFPSIQDLLVAKEWDEFFRDLSKSDQFGRIHISCGVYRSWNHLEHYHSLSIEKLKEDPLEAI